MITEQDLQEAIAECQGVKNPNANTCIKLASYYTIMDHTTNNEPPRVNSSNYSFSAGSSNFVDAAEGKPIDEVFEIIDELMNTLKVLHPKLYEGVMRRLQS